MTAVHRRKAGISSKQIDDLPESEKSTNNIANKKQNIPFGLSQLIIVSSLIVAIAIVIIFLWPLSRRSNPELELKSEKKSFFSLLQPSLSDTKNLLGDVRSSFTPLEDEFIFDSEEEESNTLAVKVPESDDTPEDIEKRSINGEQNVILYINSDWQISLEIPVDWRVHSTFNEVKFTFLSGQLSIVRSAENSTEKEEGWQEVDVSAVNTGARYPQKMYRKELDDEKLISRTVISPSNTIYIFDYFIPTMSDLSIYYNIIKSFKLL